MKVNFNNVRKVTATHLDELVKKLNQAVKDSEIDFDLAQSLKNNLKQITMGVVTICCCFDADDEENFSDLSDEIDIRRYEPEA